MNLNRIAFVLTVLVVLVLMAMGKVPPNTLNVLLAAGGFGAWLLPSPAGPKDGGQ